MGHSRPASGFTPSDVPQEEADALIAFYNATGGASWSDNTGWGTDPVVNNWFGVTVSGGNVVTLSLHTNNLVGDAGSTLDPLSELNYLYLQSNALTALDISALTSLTRYYCYANTIGVVDISSITGMRILRCYGNAMSEAEVDTIVKCIYDNWAAFTYATPNLQIHTTNAAPSGTYQDGDPPTTGKEYIYEIVNDPESTGNEAWVVTYTGQ